MAKMEVSTPEARVFKYVSVCVLYIGARDFLFNRCIITKSTWGSI